MATHAGPNLVTGSMSLYVDAGSKRSLTTIAGGWADILGNSTSMTFVGATFSAVNGGIVTFAGNAVSSATTTFNQSAEMTWDIWIKRTTVVGSGGNNFNVVFDHSSTGSGNLHYLSFGTSTDPSRFLFSYSTKFGAASPVQKTLSTSAIYVNNTWYNVCVTLKIDLIETTSEASIYVNGVFQNSTTTAAGTVDQVLNDGVLKLGQIGTLGSYPFRGDISNMRIYRRILTSEEILQNHAAMAPRFRPDVAELAALHLDAANRNSFTRVQDGWADLSTQQTTLLLSGAEHESKNGGVLTFAGTTGSFPTGSRATGNFTQSTEMTWDVWFNRTQSLSSGGNQFNMVFEHASLPYLSFGTGTDASRFLFSWSTRMGTATSVQRTLSTSPGYTDNTWYNVTCTLQLDLAATTTTARIYVNGVLAASQTTAAGTNDQIWPNSSTLRLATWGPNSQYPFKGSISNLRIYRRILTDAEILQSYNALKARFGY